MSSSMESEGTSLTCSSTSPMTKVLQGLALNLAIASVDVGQMHARTVEKVTGIPLRLERSKNLIIWTCWIGPVTCSATGELTVWEETGVSGIVSLFVFVASDGCCRLSFVVCRRTRKGLLLLWGLLICRLWTNQRLLSAVGARRLLLWNKFCFSLKGLISSGASHPLQMAHLTRSRI
jgi:hypothetical protein